MWILGLAVSLWAGASWGLQCSGISASRHPAYTGERIIYFGRGRGAMDLWNNFCAWEWLQCDDPWVCFLHTSGVIYGRNWSILQKGGLFEALELFATCYLSYRSIVRCSFSHHGRAKELGQGNAVPQCLRALCEQEELRRAVRLPHVVTWPTSKNKWNQL